MVKLHISDSLNLPLNVVTEKLAFLGRTGGGKTYAATKLCELMLEVNAPIVALDPVGKWFGLRLSADRKSKGFPVPVFGGFYGDVPLEPTGGALIADLIVEKEISAILDVSQLISSEQQRFASAFAQRLFDRRKANPLAMHLFIEECQEFVPQNLPPTESGGHAKMMLHNFERLIKLGRNYGIGASLISQRPQEVNKKVLNMTEVMFVFQMTGPQEKKAIEAWVKDKGEDESVIETLPTLKQGDAHVWSPVLLDVSKVIHIAKKKTADVSATPKVGERSIAPRELSPVDVEEIRTAMSATIEKSKQDDPKELRKRIADLERQIKGRAPVADQASIDRAVSLAVAVREKEWQASFERQQKTITTFGSKLEQIKTIAEKNGHVAISAPTSRPVVTTTLPTARAVGTTKSLTQIVSDGELSSGERKVLTVLAQYPSGKTKREVGILAGYRITGGGFNNILGALRTKGFIERGAEPLRITDDGLVALGEYEPLPTGQELIAYWRTKVGRAEREILDVLVKAYPHSLTKHEIAERTPSQYEASGGGFNNALGRLRTLELIGGRGELKAAEELF